MRNQQTKSRNVSDVFSNLLAQRYPNVLNGHYKMLDQFADAEFDVF